MRRVLHVLQMNGIGGVQELVYNLATELSNLGADIHIFTFLNADKTYIKLYQQNNIPVFISPYKPSDIRNIRLLYKYLKENNMEFVHVHNTFPQIFCSLILRLLGHSLKGVITEHSYDSKRRGKSYLRWIDEWTYKPYSKIITVSESVNNNLQIWLRGINKERFTTIVNGIDINRFAKALPTDRKSLGMSPDDFIIASVGRLVPEKGFVTIIDSLTQLPNNYKLVVIGNGPYRSSLENLIIEKGLTERVKLVGNKRNVENFLKAADMYVSASQTEGFGLTIIEAAAAGLPVIGTDIPAYRSLLPANQLFAIDDSNQLASLILRGDYICPKDIVCKYTSEAMAKHYFAIYSQI